ncbi:MAG TPA: lipocalin family protein [Holophagaceae bacterium]|nr:lipocalin family protein [Holophagaceae bacterium]
MRTLRALALTPLLAASLAAPLAAGDPPTVPAVDLGRYMGTWYEIARLPNFAEKDDGCATDTYRRLEDGRVEITYRHRFLDGSEGSNVHTAKVLDASGARWKVSFAWIFSAPYWILDLDPGYTRVLIGTPDRKYLWIESRTPDLPEAEIQALLAKARALGYDTSKLIRCRVCPAGQP